MLEMSWTLMMSALADGLISNFEFVTAVLEA